MGQFLDMYVRSILQKELYQRFIHTFSRLPIERKEEEDLKSGSYLFTINKKKQYIFFSYILLIGQVCNMSQLSNC